MDEGPAGTHHKNAGIKIQVSEHDRNQDHSTIMASSHSNQGNDDLDNAHSIFQPPPTFSIQDEKSKRMDSPQSSNNDNMDDRHLLNGNSPHENDSLPSYTSNDTIPNYENVQRNDNMQSYESTQNLTQISTPKSRRSNHDTFIGIDNPAFHSEDKANGHGKRKSHDGLKASGDEKKANNETNGNGVNGGANTTVSLGLTSPTKAPDSKVPEAVNLELVNMAPISKSNGKSVDNNGGLPPNVQGLNSIPIKKDTEVDLGGEKYDEYFVPVNEHRKYMRGEKLIVTMDKRSGKMTWKGWIWWGIGAILLLAIILAILAGAGVIGNDNPIAAPHDNFTESQARSFDGELKGGGFYVPTLDKGKASSTSTTTSTTSTTTESSTEDGFTDFESDWDKDSKEVSYTPSPSTAPPIVPPTTDSSMYYVPKAVEGELKIENGQWNEQLADPESEEFKIMAAALEKELKETIFDYQTLNFGGNNITIKVIGLEKGSVIVKYRIVWEEKPGIRGAPDPINEDSLKDKVTRQIHANFGYLGDHKVDMNSITASRVLNKCQFNKNGCQFDCVFDKATMDFACTCPPYLKLHPEGKVCITESEPEPAPEPKSEPTAEPTSEPSAEPEPEPKSEPAAEPSAEPTAEPTSEPAAEPEPKSEPAAEPAAEPTAEPSSEPAAEPTAEPEPEPEPKSEPAAEPSAEPTAEPTAEPSAEPKEVILEVKSVSKSESSAEPAAEPTAEPAPEPAAEPTAEPAAEPEPSSDIKPVGEHTSEAEPTSEPSAEPAPVSTDEHENTANEPRVLTVMVHPETTVETITEKSGEVSPVPEPGVTTIKDTENSPTPEPVNSSAEKTSTENTSHHSSAESEMTTKPDDPKSIEAVIVQNAIEKAKAENVTDDSETSMSVLPLHKMPEEKMDDENHMNETQHEIKETIESTTMTHPMLALPEDTYDEKLQSQGRFFSEDETAGIDHSNIHPGFLPEHIHSEPILPEAEYTVTENDNILDAFTPEMRKTTTETNDYVIKHVTNGSSEVTVSVSKPAPVWEVNESEDKIVNSQRDNRVIFSSIPLNTTTVMRSENVENATNPTVLAVPDNTVFSNPPSVTADDVETTTMNMEKIAKNLDESDDSGEISLKNDVDDWLSQSDSEDKTILPLLKSVDGPTVATSHVYEVSEAVNENPIYTTQNILFAKEKNSTNSEEKSMNETEITARVDSAEKVAENETSSNSSMATADDSKTGVMSEEEANHSTSTTTEAEANSTDSESTTMMPTIHNVTEHNSDNATEHEMLHEIVDPAVVSNSTSNATESELESLKKNAPRLDDDEQYMKNPQDNATEQSEKIFPTITTEASPESDEELSVAPLKKSARVNDEVVGPSMENVTMENVKEILESNSTQKKLLLEDDEDLIASSTEITKSDDVANAKDVDTMMSDSTEKSATENNMTTTENTMKDPVTDSIETTTKLVDIVMQNSPVPESKTEDNVNETVIPLHPKMLESNDSSEKVIPIHHGDMNETNDSSERVIPLHPEEMTNRNDSSERVIPLHPEEMTNKSDSSEKVIPLHPEMTESTSESVTTIKEMENATTPDPTTKGVTFVDVTEEPKTKDEIGNVLEEKDPNIADDQLNDISENETLGDGPSLGVIPLNKPKKILEKKRDKDLYYKSNEKYEKEGGINKISGEKITKQSLERDSNQETTTAVHFLANSPLTNQTHNSDSKEGANLQIIPSIRNVDVVFYSKCAAGQFQCKNGTSIRDGSYCVALSDRCDSNKDCTDGSDEDGCEVEDCPGNFKCKNGQCLKRHLVCNGILDCDDNSDEENCDEWKCIFDELSCGGDSKRCIPAPWRCDGRIHCPSGSDEAGCQSSDAVCTNGQFHCAESRMCIPQGWRCDGKVDCMGGDDERFCDCGLDEFKCKTGGGCIPKNQICDGEEQCPDLSDEWDCIRLSNTNSSQPQTGETTQDGSNILKIRKNSETWMPVCHSNSSTDTLNRVCEYLGYAGLSDVKYIRATAQDTFVTFKNNNSSELNVLFDAELTNSCESGLVVSLTCEEFVCGSHLQADMASGRVVGGDHSDEAQWPSVALVYNSILNIACTASVITPSWLLASRTCILGDLHSDPSLEQDRMLGWSVHIGKTTFNPEEDFNNGTYVPKRIIPYSGMKYNQVMYNNDLIGIKLDKSITLNGTSDAICVADRDVDEKQLCMTAGWGVYQTNVSTSREFRLNYLPLPVMDRQECNSTRHYNGLIREEHICAGYTDGEKAPCYNDEGAPLMCFNDADSKWELHGLLSYHSDCGRTRHPPVFTSLTDKPVSEWLRGIVPSLRLV